jgi:hypothetical protein
MKQKACCRFTISNFTIKQLQISWHQNILQPVFTLVPRQSDYSSSHKLPAKLVSYYNNSHSPFECHYCNPT